MVCVCVCVYVCVCVCVRVRATDAATEATSGDCGATRSHADARSLNCMKLLIMYGATVNVTNDAGQTPLHLVRSIPGA